MRDLEKTLFNNPPTQYETSINDYQFLFFLSEYLPEKEPDIIITKRVKPTGEQAELMKKYEEEHPQVKFIESSHLHDILLSREKTNEILRKHNISMPPSYTIKTKEELIEMIETNILPLPIIVKPENAQGTIDAHQMKIILEKEGVDEVQYPCLCQQYINHDNKIMKIFTIGDHITWQARSSLPNIHSHAAALLLT